VSEECLLTFITLLIGGNKKSQEAFLRYLTEEDEQNKLLGKVKELLLASFEGAKKFLGEKNAKLFMLS